MADKIRMEVPAWLAPVILFLGGERIADHSPLAQKADADREAYERWLVEVGLSNAHILGYLPRTQVRSPAPTKKRTPDPPARRLCKCGCRRTVTGRSDKVYFEEACRGRYRRKQKKARR